MKLEDIKFTERFRVRDRLDEATVQQYEQVLDQLPPVLVYQIGQQQYLVDGFHRCEAARRQGRTDITVEVRSGTDSDAYVAAIAANTSHGLPLKSKERRRAAKEFLKLFPDRSNRWIGEDLGLSHHTIEVIRAELEAGGQIAHLNIQTGRDGKQYPCTCSTCQPERAPSRPQQHVEVEVATPETPVIRPQVSQVPSTVAPIEVRPSIESSSTVPPHPNVTRSDEPAHAETIFVEVSQNPQDDVRIYQGDARHLDMLTEASVHLTVTSPPYNVGIAYGTHDDALPMDEWKSLLTEAWQECYRVTVPGGRLAVVVPDGVGRNPWLPIAPIIQQTLTSVGWVLQGQIIWDKATTGNRTTWGSYRLPTEPRLRDRHEVIVIAAKAGSYDLPAQYRKRDTEGSYSPFLEDGEVFMRLTQSVWQIAPASAQAIGHPAPFPEALASNLIRLYGFPGCMVMDPFAGSGTVGLAAQQLECKATLLDIDHEYCNLMRRRIYND